MSSISCTVSTTSGKKLACTSHCTQTCLRRKKYRSSIIYVGSLCKIYCLNFSHIHIAHCVDSIRLSLQCHADLSMVTMTWADGWLEPWPVWGNEHRCRNFNAIRDWALKNSAKTAGQIVHPQMGLVDGRRNNISALPVLAEIEEEGKTYVAV